MAKRTTTISMIALAVLALSSCGGEAQSSASPSEEEPSSSSIIVSTNNPYSNPTYPIVDGQKKPTYMADPYVIRDDDGTFYLYCTQTDVYTPNLSFNRGPIFSSSDMVNWTYRGNVFDSYTPNWGTSGAGVWAPTVIKVGDVWNFYYSLSTGGDENPGIGVATSPTPYGPWTHYGMVLDSETSGVSNSIDPQAIYYGEQLYLVWGSFYGIAATRLTDDGIEPYCGLAALKDNLTWIVEDNSGGSMDIDINYEGSYIVEIDGSWYYFGSQGTCCSGTASTYRVKVGKADDFLGTYRGSDGEKLSEGTYGDLVIGPSEDVAGTGHNTIVRDMAGDYWIVYHGFDIHGEYPSERTLFIDKLLFDESTGMPYVECRQPTYRQSVVGPCVLAS